MVIKGWAWGWTTFRFSEEEGSSLAFTQRSKTGGASGKEPACYCRRLNAGSIPGSGRSPGGGHGNPLQCSCLEDPMDRGARRATVHGVTRGRTQLKRPNTHTERPKQELPMYFVHSPRGVLPFTLRCGSITVETFSAWVVYGADSLASRPPSALTRHRLRRDWKNVSCPRSLTSCRQSFGFLWSSSFWKL